MRFRRPPAAVGEHRIGLARGTGSARRSACSPAPVQVGVTVRRLQHGGAARHVGRPLRSPPVFFASPHYRPDPQPEPDASPWRWPWSAWRIAAVFGAAGFTVGVAAVRALCGG